MTRRQRWTMVAATLGSAMVFLDGTIVTVALPRIGRALPGTLIGTLEGQTYVVSGYLAVLAALLILAGALADWYGRRRIFLMGLLGFGATSALCGIAPSLELLVVARLLQGAAGALLVPCSLAIITASFEGDARGRAFGIWASATSAVTLLGPLVGGLLVDLATWRLAFLVNLPLAGVAMWATWRYMAESRAEDATGRFDWLGAGAAVVAVGGLAFGAIRGQETAWQDALPWASLAAGAVAAVAFPLLMARQATPLVPLGLFRRRVFATLNLSTFLVYGALYTTLTIQAIYLQGTLGYTATAAGLVGLPVGILLTLLSTRVGSAAGRTGIRPFLIAGPVLMALGMLWLARLPATSAPWLLAPGDAATWLPPTDTLVDVLPFSVLFGAGMSMVVAPLTAGVMSSVPGSNAGLASAINNAVSRVGQPLLVAVVFVVVTASFYAELGERVPGADPADPEVRAAVQPLNAPRPGTDAALAQAADLASTTSFHLAALVGAALLLAGAGVNAIGLRAGREEQA